MTNQEATIRRGVRNARYSSIPNHVFEDMRLSMEARWLLCYLLSKPDHWIARIRDIRNVGNCGRDKATAMVNELIAAGYAEREQIRDGGKFGNTVLVIYDEPRGPETGENQAVATGVASLPQPDLPDTAQPDTVLPEPVNPTPSKDLDIAITDSSNLEKNTRERDDDAAKRNVGRRKLAERAYWDLMARWPNLDGLPRDAWLNDFIDLSDEDQADAVRLFPDWLAILEAGGKAGRHTPRPSTYFRKKLWKQVPEKAPPEAKSELVRPFGKGGMSARFIEVLKPMRPESLWPAPSPFVRMRIEAGGEIAEHEIMQRRERHGWPKVYEMNEKAVAKEGFVVSADALLHGADFTPVELAGLVGMAWRRLFERMRLPWLRGETDYAYFPPHPLGAEDLDAAVAAAFWGFKQRIEGDVHAAAE